MRMRGAKEKILAALFASCVLMLLASWPAGAGESDAQRLLTAVDDNLWSNTKTITGRLIIDNGRRERVLTWEVWMEGVERSFSHYLSPPREKGTKMLKIEDKLWLYTPRTDRKILIAGHLMRQSMFGSDLSYEDMMEDKKLSRAYRASLEPCTASEEAPCAVLYLLALDEGTTYHSRRLWVDPEKKIVRFSITGPSASACSPKKWCSATGSRKTPRPPMFSTPSSSTFPSRKALFPSFS